MKTVIARCDRNPHPLHKLIHANSTSVIEYRNLFYLSSLMVLLLHHGFVPLLIVVGSELHLTEDGFDQSLLLSLEVELSHDSFDGLLGLGV